MEINDLTYKINGAAFEVHSILGPGFLEKVYENALCIEMEHMGLIVEKQVPLKVRYRDKIVGDYFADLLVENKVIVELKTVDSIKRIHEAQVINYLKATGLNIGLILNFKSEKLEIKRIVHNL